MFLRMEKVLDSFIPSKYIENIFFIRNFINSKGMKFLTNIFMTVLTIIHHIRKNKDRIIYGLMCALIVA